jgi:hypothetical protein
MKSEEEIRKTRARFEEQIALEWNDHRSKLYSADMTPEKDREVSAELNRKREIVMTLHWVLDEFYSETLT